MIKIIITSIIVFIILVILILTLNVKIEYFSDSIFISKNYTSVKDNNNNIIEPNLWYKFDNANLGLNSGSYGSVFNLTNNLNVTQNTTNFIKGNSSASFNGINSYLHIPNSPSINNKNFTISFWEKRDGISTAQYGIFSLGSVSGLRRNVFVGYRPTNRMSFNFYDDDFESLTTITSTTTWNFWTFTYNTNSRIAKIYYNGNFETEKRIGSPINIDTNRLWVGRYTNIHGTANYNGLLNDLRMYEIELTNDQIFELYAGYKKVGEVIDTSTNCSANMTASGAIIEIPDPNMNINVISTITKRNDYIYSQSFGNGTITYNLTFSKYFNDDFIPTNLLLRNNKLTAFTIDNYNNNGDYTGIFTKNLPENLAFGLIKYSQKGEFIHIRFPSSIILKRYGFIADPQWISRAPGTWALYAGSRLLETSNVNSTLLVNNTTRLNNNSYCSANEFKYIHDIKDNNTSGNELLFIFPSLASSTSPNNPGRILSFMQLLLFSA